MTQVSGPPPTPRPATIGETSRVWRRIPAQPSLSEVYRSVSAAPKGAGF